MTTDRMGKEKTTGKSAYAIGGAGKQFCGYRKCGAPHELWYEKPVHRKSAKRNYF
ncbi:MAG: hypothetical protein V4511_09140 [Bacteroidota bacterium]